MLKNYFTIAWRNIIRTKAYSVINVSGLATGMAVAILIGLWIMDELNYNKSFKNHDRLGQLYHHVTFGEETMTINDVPAPIGEALKNNYAEFEEVAITSWPGEHIIAYNETKLSETGLFVEPQFASMFSVEMLHGTNTMTIGKKIMLGYETEREIIGVIKDQVRWTPFVKQSTHLYFINYSGMGYLTNRLNPQVGTREALRKIESVIKRFDAGAPFQYKFLDDDYARQFKGEERTGKLAAIFSVLTILISCIGIFGLAAFAVSQRSKEIGIRKVLGASVFSLCKMLSNDFVRLVMVAILSGTPLAYYFATQWLQQYEYRVEISWMVFVVTGLFALVITLLAVSYQALKAALMNPVRSLRAE